MPGEFYDKAKLEADKVEFQRQSDAIDAQITELEAQQDTIDANISTIDAVLAFVSANYPVVPQMSDITGFAATQLGAGISLAWDNDATADGYILERDVTAAFLNAEEIYNNTTNSWDDTGLPIGVTYYYRVKSFKAGYQDSDWEQLTVTVYDTLEQPQNLVLTPGATQADGSWDIVVNSSDYEVWRNTVNVFGSATLIETTPDNQFSHTGLTSGQIYYYWIIAIGAGFVNSAAATDNVTPS